jgi:hypothetical protein
MTTLEGGLLDPSQIKEIGGCCAHCGKIKSGLMPGSHGICGDCLKKILSDPKTQKRIAEHQKVVSSMNCQKT